MANILAATTTASKAFSSAEFSFTTSLPSASVSLTSMPGEERRRKRTAECGPLTTTTSTFLNNLTQQQQLLFLLKEKPQEEDVDGGSCQIEEGKMDIYSDDNNNGMNEIMSVLPTSTFSHQVAVEGETERRSDLRTDVNDDEEKKEVEGTLPTTTNADNGEKDGENGGEREEDREMEERRKRERGSDDTTLTSSHCRHLSTITTTANTSTLIVNNNNNKLGEYLLGSSRTGSAFSVATNQTTKLKHNANIAEKEEEGIDKLPTMAAVDSNRTTTEAISNAAHSHNTNGYFSSTMRVPLSDSSPPPSASSPRGGEYTPATKTNISPQNHSPSSSYYLLADNANNNMVSNYNACGTSAPSAFTSAAFNTLPLLLCAGSANGGVFDQQQLDLHQQQLNLYSTIGQQLNNNNIELLNNNTTAAATASHMKLLQAIKLGGFQ